uniref:histidine--tRNA ligase n=1 Tax=Megaviridae environmental sample TaxID=1737588 RepID=A0A5J6VIL8_9VIRU|nr:MAG: histidyl-tRNA synthetase [Megaviridae environmental sample]
MKLIPIPGFPELQPNEEIVMQGVMDKIKIIYQRFGFIPLDTRLIELEEVLVKKGIDNKQVYCLGRLKEGQVDIGREEQQTHALRFDLTVPLARYVGQNYKKLTFPYKRYQIQKVYRGESAQHSTGRYREFYQCDIDIIGRNKLSFTYDSELPAIIYMIFTQVLNIDRFVMRINNRKLLEGLFIEYGIASDGIKRAIKVIDDMEKISRGEICERLAEVGLTGEQAEELLELFKVVRSARPMDALKLLTEKNYQNEMLQQGLAELALVIKGIDSSGVPDENYCVDPSIARGLDYYTGTVYETNLLDYRHLGSVCSGGRYSDLISSLIGNDTKYPGVGLSIGLSRLIPALIKSGHLPATVCTCAPILVTTQDIEMLETYQRIATILRLENMNVDVFYDDVKLAKQLNYANNKGHRWVVIANRGELEEETVIVRDMTDKTQTTVSFNNLVNFFKTHLESGCKSF